MALVEESLRRIEAHNGTPERRHRPAGRRGPGGGGRVAAPGGAGRLPVLVKDLARCRGMVTTMGSACYADAPPDDVDDVVVARLKAAGAIVVGPDAIRRRSGTRPTPPISCSAPPGTPGTRTAHRAVRAEVRPRRWPPGWCRWRRRPTGADRCGYRPAAAAWSVTSRPWAASAATCCPGGSASPPRARPGPPSPTSCSRRR